MCVFSDPAIPLLAVYPARMFIMAQVRKQLRKKYLWYVLDKKNHYFVYKSILSYLLTEISKFSRTEKTFFVINLWEM